MLAPSAISLSRAVESKAMQSSCHRLDLTRCKPEELQFQLLESRSLMPQKRYILLRERQLCHRCVVEKLNVTRILNPHFVKFGQDCVMGRHAQLAQVSLHLRGSAFLLLNPAAHVSGFLRGRCRLLLCSASCR